jgi:hypothetical protein
MDLSAMAVSMTIRTLLARSGAFGAPELEDMRAVARIDSAIMNRS